MRKSIFFLFLACCVFAASFMAARFLNQKEKKLLSAFKESFAPASYVLKQSPFALVIIAFNNAASVEKTLHSIFSQNYENFRIIYVDDGSNDGSFEVARDVIYASDFLERITLMRNEERVGDLESLFKAIQNCPDEEIIAVLPNEDWLAHEWVLERLNAYYADPDLWLSLAQAIDYPTFQFPHPPDLTQRKACSFGPHLKTFYAALFKQIKESDFMQGGKFLKAAAEFAYMAPMLELGKNHHFFIPEVLSVSNKEKVFKEDRQLQLSSEKFVRSLDPYSPLTALQGVPWGD